jgi:hypothetical protein
VLIEITTSAQYTQISYIGAQSVLGTRSNPGQQEVKNRKLETPKKSYIGEDEYHILDARALSYLSPEETLSLETRDAIVCRPKLTLELGPMHQHTLHPTKMCTPPSHTPPPGSFTAIANTIPPTETHTMGSKTMASGRKRHQKVPAPPDPRDQVFSPGATRWGREKAATSF